MDKSFAGWRRVGMGSGDIADAEVEDADELADILSLLGDVFVSVGEMDRYAKLVKGGEGGTGGFVGGQGVPSDKQGEFGKRLELGDGGSVATTSGNASDDGSEKQFSDIAGKRIMQKDRGPNPTGSSMKAQAMSKSKGKHKVNGVVDKNGLDCMGNMELLALARKRFDVSALKQVLNEKASSLAMGVEVEDLGLRSPQAAPGDRARVLREAPALRRGDDRWRVFFKPDRVFATPKASVQVLLHRPADSRADQVAGLVWQLSLADRLTEFVYPAKICQLDYAVSSSEEGIGITVGGYSDKLGLFLEEIVTKVQEFSGPTPEEFARALDLVKRGQSAFDKQPPYSFATYNARLALTSPSFSIEFLRAQSARTTREDVVRLSERLRDSSQSFFGQALLHGNLDSADADRIQRTLERLQFKPQPLAGLARTRLTKLPKGQDNLLVTVHPNEDDVNNAIWSVYHTRQDTDAVVMTLLLQSILETPFFQQLRTEQQLGYIVQSSAARLTSGVGRLGLLAQSSTATPDRLMDAADGFMAKFRDVLLKLPAAEFARYKAALEELILTPAEALAEETSLWWKEISLFQYNWEQQAEEAEALRGVSQQDLLAFWDSFFAPSAPERQRFTTAVFAPKYRDAAERMATSRKAQGVSVVRNASSFADALPKWPMVDRPPPPVR